VVSLKLEILVDLVFEPAILLLLDLRIMNFGNENWDSCYFDFGFWMCDL